MRYVVATDGSEPSLKAARFFVRRSCPGPEDEVFVIYVFPLPPDRDCYEGVVPLPTEATDERVVEVARPILSKTMDVFSGTEGRINDVVMLGNPAEEIVEFAMNLGVDLVVAGTRGRSSAKKHYLGSVSGALAHRAPCSVLIVR
jgi:nucleotide-binding universal stress UspA family protein